MNQYERIVAYIHQYQDGNKGANVGYAKIEKRGDNCRIQAQLRSRYISKSPRIFLFKQMENGIFTVPLGEMTINGNEVLYKGNTEVSKVFGSELSLEEVDGLLIYIQRKLYFATSWKNDRIYLGDWRLDNGEQELAETMEISDDKKAAEEVGEETEGQTQITGGKKRDFQEKPGENGKKEENQKVMVGSLENVEKENQGNDTAVFREGFGKGGNHLGHREENQRGDREVEIAETAENSQVQMQTICGVCPFKRQNMDYGKKILLSFPTMRPFQEEKGTDCVRLELQDIGCLPMKYWSLSGNRFLLHGYYCYRHLIFCQKEQGRYLLGVPGIYSEREQKNACRFGFETFQSIGDLGKRQGAFGYWFMELM